jgi:type IV pilus assembly protein PilV
VQAGAARSTDAEGKVRSRRLKGFTLIEVLVAVLLLGVAILGAAAVQVAVLRTRHATALMSGGVQLAATLAERMRANGAVTQAGDEANPYLQLHYDAGREGRPAPGVACFGAASCNSAQLAAFDLSETRQTLYADFPDGRVEVCRDAIVANDSGLIWACAPAANAPVVIKVGWRDRRDDPRTPFAPAVALVMAGGAP